MSRDEKIKQLKVGDLVGISSGTGIKRRIYKVMPIERMTMQRFVVDKRFFYKDGLREVGGLAYLELMTPGEIKDWQDAKAREEAEREERARNYDPREHDDHVQKALRMLRDKTRTLCEKLQDDAQDRLIRDPSGAMQPHWWTEFLQTVNEIEESEHALASYGLSTSLKPLKELSSLFR